MVKNYRSCLYPLTTSSHLIRRLFLSLPVSLQLPTIKRKEQRNGGNELIAWGKDDRRQFHARLPPTVSFDQYCSASHDRALTVSVRPHHRRLPSVPLLLLVVVT